MTGEPELLSSGIQSTVNDFAEDLHNDRKMKLSNDSDYEGRDQK